MNQQSFICSPIQQPPNMPNTVPASSLSSRLASSTELLPSPPQGLANQRSPENLSARASLNRFACSTSASPSPTRALAPSSAAPESIISAIPAVEPMASRFTARLNLRDREPESFAGTSSFLPSVVERPQPATRSNPTLPASQNPRGRQLSQDLIDQDTASGLQIDKNGKQSFFTWKVENFLSFKEIMETRKIFSKFFQAGGCELRIGLYESLDTICIDLESDQSVNSDLDKNFRVRYRMAVVNQKDPTKTVWKESSICTKTWNNSVLQFMKVSDMLEADAGFLVRDTVVFVCEILDCCPWFAFSYLEDFASEDDRDALITDPDELVDCEDSEGIARAEFHLTYGDNPSQKQVTLQEKPMADAGPIADFLIRFRGYLDDPAKVKRLWPDKPDKSEELLGLIINLLEALDRSVPHGCPELCTHVLGALSQLECGSEVWEQVLSQSLDFLSDSTKSPKQFEELIGLIVNSLKDLDGAVENSEHPVPAFEQRGSENCYVIFDGGVAVGVDSLSSREYEVNEENKYEIGGKPIPLLEKEDEVKFKEVIPGVGITAYGNQRRNNLLWEYLDKNVVGMQDVESVCCKVNNYIKDYPLDDDAPKNKCIKAYICGYSATDQEFVVHHTGDRCVSGKVNKAYHAMGYSANHRLEKELQHHSGPLSRSEAVSAVKSALMNAVIDHADAGGFIKVYIVSRGSCEELLNMHAIDLALEMGLNFNVNRNNPEFFFFDREKYTDWNYCFLIRALLNKFKIRGTYSDFGYVCQSWKFMKMIFNDVIKVEEVWNEGLPIANNHNIDVRCVCYPGYMRKPFHLFMARGDWNLLKRARTTDFLETLAKTQDEQRAGKRKKPSTS